MARSQQSGSTGSRRSARIKALGNSKPANAKAPKRKIGELDVVAEENEDEDGNDGDQNSGGEPARKKAKDKGDSPQGRSDQPAPKSQGRPNEGGDSTGRRGTPDQVEAGASGSANEGGEENAGIDETEKEPPKMSATNLKLNLDFIRNLVLPGHVDEVPVGLERQMVCVSAMNEQDMRKATKILQELVVEYGTRTLLWSLRVWPIEAYMNVPIHFDGRWDVFEDDAIVNLRDNWRDTCVEAQRTNATRRQIEEFVDGYRKAKFLLKLGVEVEKDENDDDEPPNEPDQNQTQRPSFISGRARAVTAQMKHFREQRAEKVSEFRAAWGDEAADELEALCGRVFADWKQKGYPGNIDYRKVSCHFRWERMRRRFNSWSPTEVERTAFEGIYAEVREYIRRYDEFIYPPDDQQLSCQAFVWVMWPKLDDWRKDCVKDTKRLWSEALKAVPGKEGNDLYLDYNQAMRHLELGGWPMSESCVKTQRMMVRHKWRDLEAAVDADDMVSGALVKELGNEARELIDKFVFIVPPDKDNAVAWQSFIDDTLRPFVRAKNLPYWGKLWDTTLGRQHNPDDAKLLQEMRADMEIKLSGPDPPLPYGPSMAQYIRDWSEVVDRAEQEADRVTEARIKDLQTRTMVCRDVCGVLISPLLWPEETNPEQYCSNLSADIKYQLQVRWQQHWLEWKTLREIPDEEYHEKSNAMAEAVRNGQEYWPPESPAAEINRGKEQAGALGVRHLDRSGLEGSWNFSGTLGSGSYGHVGYWTKNVGHDRRIVDRIAVKESYLRQAWNNPVYWIGEPGHRKPKEFYYARELADMPESKNVVEPRSYAIYETLRMHRIYMEFCEHGTMSQMINNYIAHDAVVDEDGNSIIGTIPIRLLWSVFESLASVLCLMKSGTLPDASRARQLKYPGMIHRDLKPDNIFLSPPCTDVWGGIPTFKIGDFGFVISDADDELANMRRTGTPGFLPPEEGTSSAGDVWRTGKIMLDLMNRQSWHRERDENWDLKSRVLDDYAGNRFPPPLRDLVSQCLDASPVYRLNCEDLWTRIHAEVATGRGLTGKPLRDMKLDLADQEVIKIQRNALDRFV
ncbi:unnamed protein product [Zymoseptoria tritici ST99CH_3D1]|nr:unnamed protein product [Zymoseptoria tritici ST99CH_3D1]